MDDLNAFFSMKSNFKRETLPSGYVAGRMVPKLEPNQFPKREVQGTEYAEGIRRSERDELAKLAEYDSVPLSCKDISTVDDIDLETADDDEMGAKPVDDVYKRYYFNRILPDLPIMKVKDEILDAIDKNPVIILEGATGCGKSTQVPQFILDDAYRRKKSVNIVVTQPRRIAAVSVAMRVWSERRPPEEVTSERGTLERNFPNIIGYQIGLKVATCDDTRITFCTTGVLLEKLIARKTFCNYTHIILDEVHERSQDMDFLFIVIKKLRLTSPNVRIILMSATIEAERFADYFQYFRDEKLRPAPVIKVESERKHTISEFYWDNLYKLNVDKSMQFDIMDPKIEDEMYSAAVKLIYVFDRIDYLDSLAEQVKPTVLIFLPGIYEISCMHKQFEESTRMLQRENDFIVIILHSLITQEEQTKVLRKPTYGKRLIILSTNIAESSITVPDVKFVIDFCLTKTLVTDTNTNFSSLQLEWCSRSNCRQRAGRTGRTMDGRVYRLVPQLFYTHQMEEMSKPEMCRSPLEMVVLKAKQLDIGPPINIISMAMDVPTLSDFKNTILLLKEAGALLRTCNGKHSDDDGDITFIGIVMAALPVNIRVAKLIVIGHCFSVLSDCIIMGAGLTTKTIFVQGYKNAVTFYSKKLVWSDGSGSDLLAILKAYKSFESRKKEFGNTKNWTERYFLNEKSLMEMTNLIDELTERLSRLGIKERSGANRATWSHAEKSIILKVVIAGAFYPNYFVRSSSELEGRSAYHELNGRNPCNTVFFSGFPERFIRPLYIQSIKKRLMVCTNSPDNMRVAFDEGNEKVFVTFKQTRSSVAANTDPQLNFIEMGPGQVCIEVYKAIKLRMTSSSIHLNVMHPVDAQKYAEEHKLGAIVRGKWQSNKKTIKNIEMVCLPRKHVKSVTGQITHYDSTFNRFWFRPAEEDGLFYEIQSELNSLNRDIEPFSNYGDIYVEQVVAAAYDGNFYRAKVLAIIHGSEDIYFTVVLLDLGLEGEVEFSELRRLRGVSAKYIDIPPRVFECRLASLQPSELQSERYGWGSTMAEFKKLTEKTTVTAEIYSVDSGVASVFIRIHDCTVQEILIDSGFCRTADEDFMSKLDHDLRVKTQASNSSRFEDECDAIADEIRRMLPAEEEYEVKEPEMSLRHKKVELRGPKSPLESTIYSCFHIAKVDSKRVTIEPHSVNSVLLEANSQDTFEKFIVGANVTENQNRTEMCARETTVMPNIPGFGPLMALIFSPHCELFRDRYKSRYVAILCGLGQHPDKKMAMYSEHDTCFYLDAEIDVEDIEHVNAIRFIMDSLLQIRPDQKRPNNTEHQQIQLTLQLKTKVIALLEKERSLMGISYDCDVGWSKYDPKDLIRAKDIFEHTAIFPFHNILSLAAEDSPERLDQIHTLRESNQLLHNKSEIDVALRRPLKCLLCNLSLETVTELRIHLYSRLHIERENKIQYQP